MNNLNSFELDSELQTVWLWILNSRYTIFLFEVSRVGNPNPESAKFFANFGIRIRNPIFDSGFGFLMVRLKLAS